MAQDPLITIQSVPNLDRLIVLEGNFKRLDAITAEISEALNARYADFGQQIVTEKTGMDLSELSPAESKIVNAIGRYVALQKRDGKPASRTFQIINNRGLIDAAEVTVAKSKATQGFEVLDQADMRALSFEQIIVDHPDEFSARAFWYARRTLGLPNDSDKPPADVGTLTQQRTERLFGWLSEKAAINGGLLAGYTNADVGQFLGFDKLSRYGRVLGNIQSRIDFACYLEGVPPLGLCVVAHFANAWSQESRNWSFPVDRMRAASQTFPWDEDIFVRLKASTRTLPGQAAISWRKELDQNEGMVREWAESLETTNVPEEESIESDPEDSLAKRLMQLELSLLTRKPKVQKRVSNWIERSNIGQSLKKANGYKCQICDALGLDPIGFSKSNGEPYVEAHHAIPVSELEIGSLSASNIMIICPNHHRQMHYGNVILKRTSSEFVIELDGKEVRISRFSVSNA